MNDLTFCPGSRIGIQAGSDISGGLLNNNWFFSTPGKEEVFSIHKLWFYPGQEGSLVIVTLKVLIRLTVYKENMEIENSERISTY